MSKISSISKGFFLKPFLYSFLFIFNFLILEANLLARSNQNIRDAYPFFRYSRSTFNLLFGGMSLWKAGEVLSDNPQGEEEILSYALIGIGAARVGDGIYFLVNPTLPERYMDKGYLDPKYKHYKKALKRSAEFEKRLRTYRGLVILANGVGFMRLYDLNEKKNKVLLLPGIGMFFVSAYALFFQGPSEKEMQKLDLKIGWNQANIIFNF